MNLDIIDSTVTALLLPGQYSLAGLGSLLLTGLTIYIVLEIAKSGRKAIEGYFNNKKWKHEEFKINENIISLVASQADLFINKGLTDRTSDLTTLNSAMGRFNRDREAFDLDIANFNSKKDTLDYLLTLTEKDTLILKKVVNMLKNRKGA